MSNALSTATLAAVASRGVPVPDYDRTGLVTGIVHLGVGGFHRSHQAMVVDRLLREGKARDFAICGVGVLEQDRRMAAVMAEQDCLYTLVTKHPDGSREARVVGSIVDYLFAPDDPAQVVERLASPETRIVSLTISEGGYQADPAAEGAPLTAFGLVVAALRLRRERGTGPFTVMSCDNLAHNGAVAREAVTSFARDLDPDLGDWVTEHVRFPSSMVDRITPVTSDADRAATTEALGVEDGWPVVAEPYVAWALEDDFAAGRPPFEDAGVTVVPDVGPWERMKLRLANGGHQALCHVGVLAGFRYAHEAAADPGVAAYLTAYLDQEAAPTLEALPGLDAFKDALLGRWRNPAVADTLDRIRTDSSDRLPAWLLPVVVDNLAADGPVRASALACAAWARACEGYDDQGRSLPVLDRAAAELSQVAGAQADDPTAFLAQRPLFGDLVDEPRFREAFLEARASLVEHGALATVARFLDGGE
ncbi:MAG: mannitol dehydrogenase family protein [Nocardioides marinisabuli]|uniref:mannitol dehydrogenase family protein n=1 Tax=Nocardioides marinisabuli TaxID=419476 RepID=UPI0032197C1E